MENDDYIGKIHVIHQFDTLEYESPHKRWYCECSCGNQVVLTENEIYSQSCAKACSQLRGEICAMDLFNELGVRYIAQPGGSIRDDAVIDCCNQLKIAMAFTGMRLFHH